MKSTLTAMLLAEASKVKKYSDDQPRDDHGRFGSGGGGSSKPESSGGKTFSPSKDVHSYNYNTDRDDRIRAGTKLSHVDSSDKGEIFRVHSTGHEHQVDFSEAKHIKEVK
jgi:hypothetical protein